MRRINARGGLVLKRKINEIFYSLQGEGAHTGMPVVFVRFSGCNLKCPFCDTAHQDGVEMEDEEILARVEEYPTDRVVITGGEPSLWIDDAFIDMLHKNGKKVAIETNGTHPLPDSIDWVTCSPKGGMAPGGENLRIGRADEIKVVNVGQDLEQYFSLPIEGKPLMFLQPCYVDDPQERERNIQDTIARVKRDPRWRLSLQTHRLLNIP